jgi:hypothetical protein
VTWSKRESDGRLHRQHTRSSNHVAKDARPGSSKALHKRAIALPDASSASRVRKTMMSVSVNKLTPPREGVAFFTSAALNTGQPFAGSGHFTPMPALACRPTVNPEESDDGFLAYAFVTEWWRRSSLAARAGCCRSLLHDSRTKTYPHPTSKPRISAPPMISSRGGPDRLSGGAPRSIT